MKSLKWVLFVVSASLASPQVMAAELQSHTQMGAGSFKCSEANVGQVAQASQAQVEAAKKSAAASTEEATK